MFMLSLLVTRSSSSQVNAPCTPMQVSEDYDYCDDSLLLGPPWVPPLKVCCDSIRMNKMKCICQGVTKRVLQYYDANKLLKLSQACGNLLAPGSYCGVYKVPGGN
ncbi:unnamed protein product [Microthlaspi erraticum]|uniref:Bifunctional inhibitor/plant lipid transfer protein/seed storage helical domain-containing protein n=1 Tax=Microthlaspi erraticum TaxID=1685480 RepID=A0A6D2HB08_9BRAS|nr:unnamed protein product [Microthlaspi erraticum]